MNSNENATGKERKQMIETIASVELPIDETLFIRKNRLEGEKGGKRISIVTGIHGDELEGQYVAFLLSQKIQNNMECLKGIVDIYPAMNPLGIDSITRGIPAFDLDMNRLFPGNEEGDMTEYIASRIIKDLEGSDACIDIHASNIYLEEIPQIRINELHAEQLLPMANLLNVDYIWLHATSTVLESTLAYTLNSRKVPTLVVEMGVGMRITKPYCEQLVDGIFALMKDMGIWTGEVEPVREPIVSQDGKVCFINADVSGLFVSDTEHWKDLKKGSPIGRIIDPLEGKVLKEIVSPVDGILFTLREYPIVDEGSLIARILER